MINCMELTARIIDVDYQITDGEPVIRLFCSSNEGNVLAEVKDFQPYFYAVPSEGLQEMKEEIQGSSFEEDGEQLKVSSVETAKLHDGMDETEVLKVFTEVPPDVPKLRKKIYELETVGGTREFDIPFYKRFLIDKGLKPVETVEIEGEENESERFDIKLGLEDIRTVDESLQDSAQFHTTAFDLEVVDDEIVMCSFYGGNFEKVLSSKDIDREYVEYVEDEEELIERFVEIITGEDFEVITGYNTDEFDFKKLRERAEKHNLELSIGRTGERMKFDRRGRFSSARLKGRMHLDIYPFIAHVLAPGLDSETLDLDSVAHELLGMKKEDMSYEEISKNWKSSENLEEMADYALKDSELAYKLSKDIVPQILELSKITGLIPFDACRLTYGQLTENFLLWEARRREMLAPNRPFRKERSKRAREEAYQGGFVYSPEPGLYDRIALLDFKSLYPTVMVSHNISPELLNLEECSERFQLEEFQYDFCQDEQGFFPELIEELVEERTEIKREMSQLEEDSEQLSSFDSRQRALKILANSFYGYLGYEGARWYSRESAEATTYLGRKYIEEAIETAEETGFEVVYGDTDSVFLQADNLEQKVDTYLEKVNSELPGMMELEVEGYFERGFFTSTDSGEGAKKKYALMDSDGEMKITGFEFVRRDWSPIAKNIQEKVLRKVLENKPKEAAELVKETISRLKNGEVPVEELKIYTTLTKEPEKYESTAPHVEAVKKARKRGKEIEPETTVSYVITRGSRSISERAELTEYADSYDADYYIENQVVPVVYRVLKVFGYTEDQLKGEGRQSGLDSFG